MPISIGLALIRSSHDLLRFSLHPQAPETLIRKQKGKCKSKQYSLPLALLLFFGFALFWSARWRAWCRYCKAGDPSSLQCSPLFC